MKKLSMAELGRLSVEEFRQAEKNALVVVLDNVRSAHNVGSILRSADAFRVQKVYMCGFSAVPPHPDIRKTALGAEHSVQWEQRQDILPLLDELRAAGYQLAAAEQAEGSSPLPDFKPSGPIALVLGHEVEGVQEAVLARCDLALEIPQQGSKHSLNVSVAAGILLYALASKG